ncbi:hypothetical protein [Staphylococcus haemolyticus]|uniref:hypothetical protein n=1 Tax=Staphylococcus haemolyticus TaxID=1283 RepID=UPI0020BF958C|nr:hypothetical protein [Staphylococcus haemolyticus]
MVKVKRKVKMTLPELIEWGFKNKVFNKEFTNNDRISKTVSFDPSGRVSFPSIYVYDAKDTYTVEVEEEITEDTKLDTVLEIYNDKHHPRSVSSAIQKNTSINNIMEYNPSYFNTETLYLVNEDMTLTLIWKDGELVGDE